MLPAQAQAQVFTIDGDEHKKADNLKYYLGHQISSRDSDFLALFLNLSKATRKRLTRISRLHTCEQASNGASLSVDGISLLYGLETWVWSTLMLNTIHSTWVFIVVHAV